MKDPGAGDVPGLSWWALHIITEICRSERQEGQREKMIHDGRSGELWCDAGHVCGSKDNGGARRGTECVLLQLQKKPALRASPFRVVLPEL